MPDGEKRAVGAPVVLVSASPRRHELLARLLPVFELAHSLVEERQPRDLPDRDLPPLPLPPPFRVLHKVDPRLWAWRKALDYLSHVSYPAAEVVLSADTAVAARTELLGKPQDHDDAMRMLRLLSGESHY